MWDLLSPYPGPRSYDVLFDVGSILMREDERAEYNLGFDFFCFVVFLFEERGKQASGITVFLRLC